VAPLFVTGTLLFYYQYRNKTEVLQNYSTITKISSDFIKQEIENAVLRLNFINDAIYDDIKANKITEAQAALDNALDSNHDLVFLALADSSGKEILRRASGEISSGINSLEFALGALPKNFSAGSTAVISSDDNPPFPLVGIVHAVKGGGYLYVVINMFNLCNKFAVQHIGKSGGIFFAKTDGTFINFNGKTAPAVKNDNLARALHLPDGLIKDLADVNGRKIVGAAILSPVPDIYITVLQYKKEAYYALNFMGWIIAFFILATTTLSYFTALSFSQEISEPIDALVNAARKISNNDFNVSLDARSSWGEFDVLTNAVNAMAVSLSHYQAVQLDKILDEKKKTDLLASLMRDGIIMCSMKGKKLFINKSASKILNSISYDGANSGKKRTLKDLLSVRSGTVFNCKENGVNVYYEMLKEFFNPANEEPLAIIIFRDITSEYEINEMKNDIFNAVAHDLRVPLLGLQAYIMILQESVLPEEKKKEILRSMALSSNTLSSLVENILDASKLERGLMLLKLEEFDISLCAQKVIDAVKPIAAAAHDKIKNEIKKGVFVKGDKNLIERVFSNLISNAIKFTKNGNVEISYDFKDGEHHITVNDDGIGIKETDINKIFEKYRAFSSADGHKGYGLGLNISKQIITAHGGTISAESKEGAGAKFTFTLPQNPVITQEQEAQK
jgi:signal transduction histidine kinase